MIGINGILLTALWAILALAALFGAVTFFILVSIAWAHKPISLREFTKSLMTEIKNKCCRKNSGSRKERCIL